MPTAKAEQTVRGRIAGQMALLLLGATFTYFSLGGFAHADDQQLPSILECSALSGSPVKRPRFAMAFSFSFANGGFKAVRPMGSRPGREVYSGSIDQNRHVRITGRGAFYDYGSPWRSEFSGKVNENDLTVLAGKIEVDNGGRRECSLTFLLPPDKLAAILAPQSPSRAEAKPSSAPAPKEVQPPQARPAASAPGQSLADSSGEDQTRKRLSDLAQDLADKQKQILAMQEDLKKQESEAARDFAAKQKQIQEASAKVEADKDRLDAGQAKLDLATKDLNDRQKSLEASHKDLKQEQANLQQEQGKTKGSVNLVQKLLDGIILPTTEDPDSWLVRVAAVPIQQQQFCRIVDQFHDSIDKVYQTRNDIKKNSLFRDRQLSMAALLPHGEFSNWVVQIKEVTQAPDGSAAIMLQPPCRAMLGSDACQKNGSKVQATIPPDSPLYRELSSVSAGDFVVVSGKILYAEAPSNQPLPTYATYQAGSHCSATEGSKQEDVFVTNITYLVQLR
jgi:hypothetical protein